MEIKINTKFNLGDEIYYLYYAYLPSLKDQCEECNGTKKIFVNGKERECPYCKNLKLSMRCTTQQVCFIAKDVINIISINETISNNKNNEDIGFLYGISDYRKSYVKECNIYYNKKEAINKMKELNTDMGLTEEKLLCYGDYTNMILNLN